jgi:predicted RNA-binding protein Jag
LYSINKNIKKIKMTKKQTTEAVKETIQEWLIDVFDEMDTDNIIEMLVDEHGIEIETETQLENLRTIVNTERNNIYQKVSNCLFVEAETTA